MLIISTLHLFFSINVMQLLIYRFEILLRHLFLIQLCLVALARQRYLDRHGLVDIIAAVL
jgi:uncharacterized membrane protein